MKFGFTQYWCWLILGKYFYQELYNPTVSHQTTALCCEDLVVFLFFLAESSKYSCKLFFKLLPPVVLLVYLLSQKTNNRSHYPHLFFWDSIPLIIMLLCTGWPIIDCSISNVKRIIILTREVITSNCIGLKNYSLIKLQISETNFVKFRFNCCNLTSFESHS